MRTSLQHYARVNLIGALSVTPGGRRCKLHLQRHRTTINGPLVIRFLQHLLRRHRGALVVVWDRHPMHWRKTVQHWLDQQPRVQVEALPIGAPELNPVEWVWAYLSAATAGTAPHNEAELRATLQAARARMRRSQRRLWGCIHASELPWP